MNEKPKAIQCFIVLADDIPVAVFLLESNAINYVEELGGTPFKTDSLFTIMRSTMFDTHRIDTEGLV